MCAPEPLFSWLGLRTAAATVLPRDGRQRLACVVLPRRRPLAALLSELMLLRKQGGNSSAVLIAFVRSSDGATLTGVGLNFGIATTDLNRAEAVLSAYDVDGNRGLDQEEFGALLLP